jgi:transposase
LDSMDGVARRLPMSLALTTEDRATLAAALARAKRVRQWRRYQAVLLVGDGTSPEQAAHAVGASRASVYNWVASWQRDGVTALADTPRPATGARRLDGRAEGIVNDLLASDPQQHGYHATGWTVPLVHGELVKRGYAVSARTTRRTLHRLGWRWKRPKYVLGRPDPAYAEKKGR